MTNMNYSLYLFSNLVKFFDKEFNELPYDEQWDFLPGMYIQFRLSKFNVIDKGEYDCITDYLEDREKEKDKDSILEAEEYYNLPIEVLSILNTISDDADYDECDRVVKELNSIGYTAKYGLDGSLYEIAKKDLELEQKKIKQRMYEDGWNVVTCASCGTVIFVSIYDDEDIECHGCNYKGDQLTVPNLNN